MGIRREVYTAILTLSLIVYDDEIPEHRVQYIS